MRCVKVFSSIILGASVASILASLTNDVTITEQGESAPRS